MAGIQSSVPKTSFTKQWLPIGVVLGAVAAGAVFAVSSQMRGSRTASPTDEKRAAIMNSDVMGEAIIPVEGMSCAACAARVKGTLKSIDGVAAVEVGLAERNVRVRYVEGTVTPEALAAEINAQGYKAGTPIGKGDQ